MIVKVDESNIAAAGAVHAQSWRASHGFCSPEFVAAHTAQSQTEFLQREIGAGRSLYLLLDPEPAGIVSVRGDLIEHLYVLPGKWHQGCGTRLLEFAAERCNGTPRLWVLSSNEVALRFYERRGFRESGERRELKGGLAEIEMKRSRLETIRRAEAESHTAAYNAYTLYAPGSWLSKPVPALMALLPLYADRVGMRVLDLGSGVGRNAIAAAQTLADSTVECVDILPMAIEKLLENAAQFGVKDRIRGIAAPVDSFPIEKDSYDLILAGSVLEHLDSPDSSKEKLRQIERGIRPGGAVMIVMNTGVREWDTQTGEPLAPQFEVNLPPQEVRELFGTVFSGWQILWDKQIHQQYDVPRGERRATIDSEVVTFTARRMQ